MATNNYTDLIEKLETLDANESDQHAGYCECYNIIHRSDLSSDDKEALATSLVTNHGTQVSAKFQSNGVKTVITLIKAMDAANDDSYDHEPTKTITASQLTKMVNNGRIFGVSFIKRTTGELRTMSCRLGVKKFLRGGKMAYSPEERQLLTVFSMKDKGYRMIPIEGIQRVNVGGQTFTMGVV